jgi:quinol monooxygenase YgiN
MLTTKTTIEQGRGIVTLINTFTVEPDKQQAIVDALSEITATTMRHLPGFIGASVHKSLDGTHVANYVQWETQEHFAAMFQNPDAAAHMDHVSGLATSIQPILYSVAYVGAETP